MFAYYPPEWESLSSRIVGRWCPSFSGATGLQLPNTSRFGNHGVLTNMDRNTSWVASGGKGALDFDGNINDVRFASNPAFNIQNPSFSMWVYMRTQNGGIKALIDYDHGVPQGWVIQSEDATTTRTFYFAWVSPSGYQGNGPVSRITIPLEKWSHICYVKNGPIISGYLDGQLIYSFTTINGTIVYNVTIPQVCIGGCIAIGGRQWNGQMDDITIFNTPLTANEVRFIYEQGRGGGMLYQPPRRRSYFAQVTTFKNYWFRNQQRMIGGGIR
jgi:hypothetical protein